MENQKLSLVHKNENLLYIVCITISIVIIISLLISIVGALIFASFAILSILSHAISMAHIQLNGV